MSPPRRERFGKDLRPDRRALREKPGRALEPVGDGLHGVLPVEDPAPRRRHQWDEAFRPFHAEAEASAALQDGPVGEVSDPQGTVLPEGDARMPGDRGEETRKVVGRQHQHARHLRGRELLQHAEEHRVAGIEEKARPGRERFQEGPSSLPGDLDSHGDAALFPGGRQIRGDHEMQRGRDRRVLRLFRAGGPGGMQRYFCRSRGRRGAGAAAPGAEPRDSGFGAEGSRTSRPAARTWAQMIPSRRARKQGQ